MERNGIPRIPPRDEVPAKQNKRVQPHLEAYSAHVVHLLIGTKGLDENEVVRSIVREWIQEHRAELDEKGIQPPAIRDNGIIIAPEEKAG